MIPPGRNQEREPINPFSDSKMTPELRLTVRMKEVLSEIAGRNGTTPQIELENAIDALLVINLPKNGLLSEYRESGAWLKTQDPAKWERLQRERQEEELSSSEPRPLQLP